MAGEQGSSPGTETGSYTSRTRVSGRRGASPLYEHAFLPADGREVSLWEVEHTATPDGRHMCEVYETEDAGA